MTSPSRSWFPGRIVPLARLTSLELLSPLHRSVRVQVGTTTVYGTANEAAAIGLALLKAAMDADPVIAAAVQRTLSHTITA
jgi:hypothetical protein